MEIFNAINNLCDAMMIDLRFILCSNFVLHFLFKGSEFSTTMKKVISIGFMLALATVCWFFLDMSGEKLLWSIPCALCGYDYVIKPLYKKWLAKIQSETVDIKKSRRKKKTIVEQDPVDEVNEIMTDEDN